MDHVTLVIEDLDAAIEFFRELGMDLEGRTSVDGDAIDQLTGMDRSEADIAMVRTPDGHGRIELTHYRHPRATTLEPGAPPNTLGFRQVMFEVDDIDATVARLRRRGSRLIGEVVPFGDTYRLGYLRGPEGIIVALAQAVGAASDG
jgi:catechol 2,3-dioxygenase-like lactoylglutathione lyase family enzyme